MSEYIEVLWSTPEEAERMKGRYVGIYTDGNWEFIESLIEDAGNAPPDNSFAFIWDEGTPEEKAAVCFREGTPAYAIFDAMRKEGKQIYQDEHGRKFRIH